ncbi:MAG TPA: hypothetical protein VGK30_06395 [Candidatus Binatia bacterium]
MKNQAQRKSETQSTRTKSAPKQAPAKKSRDEEESSLDEEDESEDDEQEMEEDEE